MKYEYEGMMYVLLSCHDSLWKSLQWTGSEMSERRIMIHITFSEHGFNGLIANLIICSKRLRVEFFYETIMYKLSVFI